MNNIQKTTIQKLIETVKEIDARGITLTMDGFVTVLENSLDSERKQIIEACDINFAYDKSGWPTLGEQYYDQFYKHNSI